MDIFMSVRLYTSHILYKPILYNVCARPGHGYQAGRTNAQCAHSIHQLISQLKYGLHYD